MQKAFNQWSRNILSTMHVLILQLNVCFHKTCTHIELSKLPTWPGVSPGVGWWKQGLLMLHTMPWTHASVPAEGRALLGKWPA